MILKDIYNLAVIQNNAYGAANLYANLANIPHQQAMEEVKAMIEIAKEEKPIKKPVKKPVMKPDLTFYVLEKDTLFNERYVKEQFFSDGYRVVVIESRYEHYFERSVKEYGEKGLYFEEDWHEEETFLEEEMEDVLGDGLEEYEGEDDVA